MTRQGFFWRLAISVIIDLADFTLGRIPILGTVEDGVGGIVATALWGRAGLAYFWELADITVRYSMTESDWREVYRLCNASRAAQQQVVISTPHRKAHWILVSVSAVLLLVVAILSVDHLHFRSPLYWLPLLLICMSSLASLAHKRAVGYQKEPETDIDRAMEHFALDQLIGEWVVTLTAQGVSVTAPAYAEQRSWPSIAVFSNATDFVTITYNDQHGVFIPMRAFASPAAASHFVTTGNSGLWYADQGLPRRVIRWLSSNNLPCPKCKYNLRGITDMRCPECGRTLEYADVPKAFERSALKA